MALDKATLKNDILSSFTSAFGKTSNPQGAMNQFAIELSEAIDKFVKSGDVVIDAIPVITSGSPTSHTGTGTGTYKVE